MAEELDYAAAEQMVKRLIVGGMRRKFPEQYARMSDEDIWQMSKETPVTVSMLATVFAGVLSAVALLESEQTKSEQRIKALETHVAQNIARN